MARVCQVSLSDVATDGRILRTVHAMETEGHAVEIVDYGRGLEPPRFDLRHKLIEFSLKAPSNVLPAQWPLTVYWANPQNRKILRLIQDTRPDIIHAHNWPVLPAAARAARNVGAKLVYDSHEFAQEERPGRRLWQLTYTAYIRALERLHIHHADAVITVSEGIADRLHSLYQLSCRPLVVANMPEYVAIPHRPARQDRILVHYHGIFTQSRGLRTLVRSVALWPDRFRLRLTGWAQPPSFEANLRETAETAGVTGRVDFAPRVSLANLIQHASEADIGAFVQGISNAQQLYTLPNKFFEYTMAGLMLIVGPGRDMRRYLERHAHGIALDVTTAEALAVAISNLDAETVTSFKRRALNAGRILSWNEESIKLKALYRKLTGNAPMV
ncbi:MAG: hypothetical protein RLZ98_3436 [Pseudomonadota bacterium]